MTSIFKNKESGKTYEIVEKVAVGGFGEVHKAKDTATNLIYAIKIIKFNEEILDQINNEKSILNELSNKEPKCRFLIYLEDTIFIHELKYCIITQFYKNGSLRNKIKEKKKNNEFYDDDSILKWIKSIIIGIDYLHFNRIIHRDLKPENILMDDENDIKIADFGVSKTLFETTYLSSKYGTFNYMSPELLQGKYSFKTDIWSCGCILFELLFIEQFYNIRNHPEFEKVILEKFLFLLTKMLTKNTNKRLNANDLVNLFEKINKMNSLETLSYRDFDNFEQTELLSNTLPKRNEYFVGRDEIFNQLDYLFSNKIKVISLYSESGFGKSSIALEYGQRFIEKDKESHHVYWIKSDGNNLEIEFKNLGLQLEIDIEKIQDLKELIDEIKNKFSYYNKKIIFIFDNFENFESNKCYLELLILKRNINIIITTNQNYEEYFNGKIFLKPLSQIESLNYLKKKFNNSKDKDIKELFKLFNLDNDEYIRPLDLNMIIGYINYNYEYFNDLTEFIEEYSITFKEKIENKKQNLEQDLIELIINNEEIKGSKEMMKYTTLLDPDSIPIEIYANLFELDKKAINKCINFLNKIEIFEIVRKNKREEIYSKVCKIHRYYQKIFMKIFSIEENDKEKQDLIIKISSYLENKNELIQNKLNKNEKITYFYQLRNIVDNILNFKKVDQEEKIKILNLFATQLKNDKITLNESNLYFQKILEYNENLGNKESNKTYDFIKINVYQNIGNIKSELGKYNEALEYYEKSLVMSEKIHSNVENLEISIILNKIGGVYQSLGKNTEALEYFEKSLKIKRKIHKNDDNIDVSSSFDKIGEIYLKFGKFNEALEYFLKSLTIFKKKHQHNESKKIHEDDDNIDVSISLKKIGLVYEVLNKFDKALDYYEKSLAISQKIFPNENDLDVSDNEEKIGDAYVGLEKYNEALKHYEKSLGIRQKIYPNDENIDVSNSLERIGEVYMLLKDYNIALYYYEKSLKILRKINPSEEDFSISVIFEKIGEIYERLGKFNDALEYYEKSFNICKKIYPNEQSLDLSVTLIKLGDVKAGLKKYDEALNNYKKSLEIRRKIYKEDENLDISISLENIGNAYAWLGDYIQALDFFQQSLKIRRNIYQNEIDKNLSINFEKIDKLCEKLGQNNEKNFTNIQRKKLNKSNENKDITTTLNKIGEVYERLEQYNEALEYYKESLNIFRKIFPNDQDLNLSNIEKLDFNENFIEKEKIYPNDDYTTISVIFERIGEIYEKLGKYNEALDFYKKSLIINEKLQKNDNILYFLNMIADIYIKIKKYDFALEFLHKSLNVCEEKNNQTDNSLDVLNSVEKIGEIYEKLGNYNKALIYYEKSLRISGKIYSNDDNLHILTNTDKIAKIYALLGKYRESIDYYEKSLKNRQKIYSNEENLDISINLDNIGDLYLELGKYNEALEFYEKSLRICQNTNANEDNLEVSNSLDKIGYLYQMINKYNKALDYYNKSLEIRRKIYLNDENIYISGSFNKIADLYKKMYLYSESLDFYERSLKIIEKIYPNDDNIDVSFCLDKIGDLYLKLEKYELALEFLEKSLKIKRKIYSNDDRLNISYMFNKIGKVYTKLGKYNEALNNYERSLTIFRKIHLNDDNIDVSICLDNIGDLYLELGKYNEALEFYEKSLKICQNTNANEDNLEVSNSLDKIGNTFKAIGKYNKALEFYQKSQNIRKMIFHNTDSLDVSISLNYIGDVYLRFGQYNQALKYYEESLKIRRNLFKDDNNLNVSISLNKLGEAFTTIGRYTVALDYFEKSLNIIRKINLNDDNLSASYCLNKISDLYVALGRYSEALEYFEKSLNICRKLYSNDINLDTFNVLLKIVFIFSKFNNSIIISKLFKDINTIFENNKSFAPNYTRFCFYMLFSFIHFNCSSFSQSYDYFSKVDYISYDFNFLDTISEDTGDYFLFFGLIKLSHFNEYEKAIEYLEKCLGHFCEIYQNENHFKIAKAFNGIGHAYFRLNNFIKAEEFYNKSLNSYLNFFKDDYSQDLAILYENMNEYYEKIKNISESNKCKEKALDIRNYLSKLSKDLTNRYKHILEHN